MKKALILTPKPGSFLPRHGARKPRIPASEMGKDLGCHRIAKNTIILISGVPETTTALAFQACFVRGPKACALLTGAV